MADRDNRLVGVHFNIAARGHQFKLAAAGFTIHVGEGFGFGQHGQTPVGIGKPRIAGATRMGEQIPGWVGLLQTSIAVRPDGTCTRADLWSLSLPSQGLYCSELQAALLWTPRICPRGRLRLQKSPEAFRVERPGLEPDDGRDFAAPA